MQTTKTIAFFAFFAFFAAGTGTAQESPNRTKWSLEIDPATFVWGGFSAHLRIQPKNAKHLVYGVGVYAMNMPDLLVGFDKNNKDQGWNVRINRGYGVFAEHHFVEVNRRWFAGGQASLQEYKIERDDADGSAKYTNALLMAFGGYAIQPFNFNLYFKPWAGVGYTGKISGQTKLGDAAYHIAPITMFATLHVGYSF